jgi:deoxyribodipyrimidine photolyase-related protein
MSQFADGGIMASKPYAASANYISKMSDHCTGCRYSHTKKTGEGACPFNALYWDFLVRNRNRLNANPRLSRVYDTWDRMDGARQREYRDSAAAFLESLD